MGDIGKKLQFLVGDILNLAILDSQFFFLSFYKLIVIMQFFILIFNPEVHVHYISQQRDNEQHQCQNQDSRVAQELETRQ